MRDEVQLLAEKTDLIRSPPCLGSLNRFTQFGGAGPIGAPCLSVEELPCVAQRDRLGGLVATRCAEPLEIQGSVRTSWVRKQMREHAKPFAVAEPGHPLRVCDRPVLALALEPGVIVVSHRCVADASVDAASPYRHKAGMAKSLCERRVDRQYIAFGAGRDKRCLAKVSAEGCRPLLIALPLVAEHAESQSTLFSLDRTPDSGGQGICPQSGQGAGDACSAQDPAATFAPPGDLQARLVIGHSAPIVAAVQRKVAEAMQRVPDQSRKRGARQPNRIREQPLTLVVRALITRDTREQVQCRCPPRVVGALFEQRQGVAMKDGGAIQIRTLARDAAEAVEQEGNALRVSQLAVEGETLCVVLLRLVRVGDDEVGQEFQQPPMRPRAAEC